MLVSSLALLGMLTCVPETYSLTIEAVQGVESSLKVR